MLCTLARIEKELAQAKAEPEPGDEQGSQAYKRCINAKQVNFK